MSAEVGCGPSPSLITRNCRPESVVWYCIERVPYQATPTAMAASRISASQSFSTDPFLMGRIGTAVADIGDTPVEGRAGGQAARRAGGSADSVTLHALA